MKILNNNKISFILNFFFKIIFYIKNFNKISNYKNKQIKNKKFKVELIIFLIILTNNFIKSYL